MEGGGWEMEPAGVKGNGTDWHAVRRGGVHGVGLEQGEEDAPRG